MGSSRHGHQDHCGNGQTEVAQKVPHDVRSHIWLIGEHARWLTFDGSSRRVSSVPSNLITESV